VNQKDYNVIVGYYKDYLEKVGQKIVKIETGEIVVDLGDQQRHYYLDNLVRVLAQSDKIEWEKIVNEHLDKNQVIPFATEYLYKDFEYASQFLKVYLKSAETFPKLQPGDYVHRVDLPETRTFLILDFHEQFHFVKRENIVEWNKSEEELLEIGFANVSVEKIEIEEVLFKDQFNVFTLLSGDFSASFIIELEKNAGFAVGTHGSIVAIPTKGSAFIHPIENDEVLDVIAALSDVTKKFFDEDPGNITTNFYWYHDGKFELFPKEQVDKEYSMIKWPLALKERLGIA
jgi:hypothetical protein